MAALFLTEAEVARLLDIRTAIDLVEEAFRRLAAGEATNVPRVRAVGQTSVLHAMSASADYLGYSGAKLYATVRGGARFHLALYSQASGELEALIEANRLGQLRTGATTAVAAASMAPLEAVELGLFGAGFQAETQLAALSIARPIKEAFVYSRALEHRVAFADRMSTRLGINVTPVDRPQDAAEDLPIVVTATTSREPVFDGNWLAEGTHVAAVGSNWWNRAEIDVDTVRRADTVVCDSVEACRREAGDFRGALEKGIFDWSRAIELADVVTGRAVGRRKADSITLFKSVGLAVEDVALGVWLLERARAEHVGVPLPF